MILISHRGNLNGENKALENSIDYIESALNHGFDVEVDVRLVKGIYYLGHDKPQYEVNWTFLTRSGVWCHAKDIDTLNSLLSIGAHCFWHQEDDVTLTSKGYIWTLPGKKLTSRSICVLPETVNYDTLCCSGICSDFILDYREKYHD